MGTGRLILLLATLVSCYLQLGLAQQRCQSSMDLIIAIDGSNSIQINNFETLKGSISGMVENLPIGNTEIQVGVTLFGSEVTSTPLSGNRQAVLNTLRSLEYPDAETRTDLGIIEAINLFRNGGRRGSVPRLLIIVTDGTSTRWQAALNAATNAKNQGINIWALGVTDDINIDELRQLASSQNQVRLTQDFNTLRGDLIAATEQACINLECASAMIDMVFMLDSSQNIGPQNFEAMKQFVDNFLFFADVDNGNIRVGVMTYGQTPRAQFQMFQYIGNKRAMTNAVTSLQYTPSGGTNLAAAFRFVREQMYTPQSGDRTDIPNVVIFLSGSTATLEQAQTRTAAEAARADGIQIYGVGVGLPNTAELDLVTSRPLDQNRFFINSFGELNNILQNVFSNFNRFCATPPPVPACFMGNTDIWYVVDLSRNAEQRSRFDFTNDFAHLKRGLREGIEIVTDPSVNNQGVQIGLVTYSDNAQILVRPTDQNSPSLALRAVDQIPGQITPGVSNLLQALQTIQTRPRQSQWRSYVALVTPSSVLNNQAVMNELRRVHDLDYRIIFFSVNDGNFVNFQQLAAQINNDLFVYNLPRYQDLEEGTKNFTRDILCAPPQPRQIPISPKSPGLCAPTNYQRNGMAVVAHPTDCDKYIQCYYNPTGDFDLAVVRNCQMGLFWSQQAMQCTAPDQAGCPLDPCREECEDYKMQGACGAYWHCEGGRSQPQCCNRMHIFVPGKGCQFDITCAEDCGPEEWCGMCMRKPNFQMSRGYEVGQVGPGGARQGLYTWSPRPCLIEEFDAVDCDCTVTPTNACPPDHFHDFRDSQTMSQAMGGTRSGLTVSNVVQAGNNGLQLQDGSIVRVDVNKRKPEANLPFTVAFSFQNTTAVGPYGKVLLTSGVSCGDGNSLIISANDHYIRGEIRAANGEKAVVRVPYAGIQSEVKNVMLTYEDGEMTMSVRGQFHQYIERVSAPRHACFNCGLDIGGGLNTNSFNGILQTVAVYSCVPERLYDVQG